MVGRCIQGGAPEVVMVGTEPALLLPHAGANMMK